MGHTRIGRLNRSRQWREVVGLFCGGADFGQIANAVLTATEAGFNIQRITNDLGYQKAAWLLVQMGIGAQSGEFIKHMKNCGIELSERPSVQELNARLYEAIDDAAWGNGVQTDLSIFAKQALSNAVTACVNQERSGELPLMPQKLDADIFNRLGSKANFAEINRVFASEIMARGLNNYLSKILPNMVGDKERVMSIHELKASYDALHRHCYETGVVEKDYANTWLAKHRYVLKDMNDNLICNHGKFLIKKMMKALKYGKD